MKIDANSIRVGNTLEHDGKLWVVLKTMHTQPGKGGAYMQVEMKEIRSGSKKNVRFRSDENVERAQLEERAAQFLYQEQEILQFMDSETFEQINVSKNIMNEDKIKFLEEGKHVILEFYKENVITVKLSETMIVEIAKCDVAIKNQTASSSYKPAILTNGVRITVPPFIESGEKILINIEELKYLERAK
jgi:elongation factor P